MNEQDYISIINYLDGELSLEERKSFEKRLKEDGAFKKAYQEQKTLIKGVSAYERKEMKAMLGGIHTTVVRENTLKKYKPTNGGSSGSSFGSIISKIIGICFIGAIVSFVLIMLDKFPVEHPVVDKIQEYQETLIVRDTIYQEIYVPAGTPGADTIIIYEDELNGRTIEEYIEEEYN